MLFLDGVYIDGVNGSCVQFRWVKAPTSDELTELAHRISQRTAGFLERKGLLARDTENSYLDLDGLHEGPLNQIQGHSITYRIAVGPQQGRKVFTLQTLPVREPDEPFTNAVGKAVGFSLHAGVAGEATRRAFDVQGCTNVWPAHGCASGSDLWLLSCRDKKVTRWARNMRAATGWPWPCWPACCWSVRSSKRTRSGQRTAARRPRPPARVPVRQALCLAWWRQPVNVDLRVTVWPAREWKIIATDDTGQTLSGRAILSPQPE